MARLLLLYSLAIWCSLVGGAPPLLAQNYVATAAQGHDILEALLAAQVVPDVLPYAFSPSVSLQIEYSQGKDVRLGNQLEVNQTTSPPSLQILPLTSKTKSKHRGSPQEQAQSTARRAYTLVLTDPDAPSRADPSNSQFCHWIITGLPVNGKGKLVESYQKDTASTSAVESAQFKASKTALGETVLALPPTWNVLVPYRAPTPPPTTGRHRYVFVLLEAAKDRNQSEPLNAPDARGRWGKKSNATRPGVEEWAAANALIPVGANFFYAEDPVQ